jgi:hypothetical protein
MQGEAIVALLSKVPPKNARARRVGQPCPNATHPVLP